MRQSSLVTLLCLAPAATFGATLRRRDLAPATGLSGGWTYTGCYVDSVGARALNGSSESDGSNMSAETCTVFCGSNGYNVAGTEYSAECYCGKSVTSQAADDPTTCNMACSGNSTQVCGGSDRLSVYTRPATLGPQTNPGPAGYLSLGCYNDTVSARALSNFAASGDQITVAVCAATCAGSQYFGVEYAGECFCGDTIDNRAMSVDNGCTMPCKGNSSEYCGGSDRINLYQAAQTVTSTFTSTQVSTIAPSSSDVSSAVASSSVAPTPSAAPAPAPSSPAASSAIAPSSSSAVAPSTSSSAPALSSSTAASSTVALPSIVLPSLALPSLALPSLTLPSLSLPAISLPSLAPSVSPQPACTATIQTGGQISNGGFEGTSTWARSQSNAVSSELYGFAYEGCRSELFHPTNLLALTSSASIKSDASITANTMHTITFYVGRRSTALAINAAVTLTLTPSLGAPVVQMFDVCTGLTCDLKGTGGTVWRKYTTQVTFGGNRKSPLQFTTSWAAVARTDGTDDVLIDGIYVS